MMAACFYYEKNYFKFGTKLAIGISDFNYYRTDSDIF